MRRRRSGGRCSTCSPRQVCGSPRRSLRWSDLHLDGPAPRLQVSRAIVKGVVGAPKSRHGNRLVPLPAELAATLSAMRPASVADDAFVFPGREGGPSDPGALRRRVLVPAASRADLSGVGFHTLRHTCASLLIESGLNVLRLQRWMGHHSPAFTLEVYGHLLDGGDLGPPLDLRAEVHAPIRARHTATPGVDQGLRRTQPASQRLG
jgi:integrase